MGQSCTSTWRGAWSSQGVQLPCLARPTASLVPFSSCLSSICCLPLLVKLCSRWAGAEKWRRFCRAKRGSSSLCCDPALVPAQPGAVFGCRGCSRWRGCPGTGGTAINSLCPQSSVPHREWLLLVLQVQLLLSPWKILDFGVRVLLWVLQPGPNGLEKGQYLQHN